MIMSEPEARGQDVADLEVRAPARGYSTFPPAIILVQRFCISAGLTCSLVAARDQR